MRPRQIELARCLRHVPVVDLEALAEVAALEGARRLLERGDGGAGGGGAGKYVVGEHEAQACAVGADGRGLERVRELADVARPCGLAAGEQGMAGEGEQREAMALA